MFNLFGKKQNTPPVDGQQATPPGATPGVQAPQAPVQPANGQPSPTPQPGTPPVLPPPGQAVVVPTGATQQQTAAAQKATLDALKQGSVSLADVIAPPSAEVDFKHVRVGDRYFRTFFVADYPREVSPNWLSILIDHKETMNISMFIYPVESKDVLSNLRRKIAEMEATIDSDQKAGLEPDPKIQASLEDAVALREELARGLERFFQFGLYVTISADTPQALDEKARQLQTLLASNLLLVKPATLQMEEGFKTTMPYGSDKLFITRNMDTTSVASTFPFTSYEISQPDGILYGVNTLNNSLVIVDRFSFENANEVVFGKSGSGKSFLVKLEVLRQMMFDAEILIIDPEDEYHTLCSSLGGEYIDFSKTSEVKINPFALLSEDRTEAQLGIKILSLHGLLKTMIGDMSPTQEAILDRSLVLVYKQKGITPDPATYDKEPPILEDLYKTLLNMEENEAKELAFRLEKYVKGGFAGLLNAQTNYDIRSQLTVFSIKQLEDALRPIAMHVILDFIWSRVRTKLKKRLLIVDEAWYMMKYPDSASFLQGIAKRARKYYLGMTTLTQDIEDFLNNDYGKAIVSNSSIQILLKQGTAEVEALAKAFMLSEGEKQFLLTAQVGEGLLFAGQNHISAQFIASQFEYDLITSKPQDIMDQQAASTPPPAPENPPTPTEPEPAGEEIKLPDTITQALEQPSTETPPAPQIQTPQPSVSTQPAATEQPISTNASEVPSPVATPQPVQTPPPAQPTPPVQPLATSEPAPLSFGSSPASQPIPVISEQQASPSQSSATPVINPGGSQATNHTENMVRSQMPTASSFPKSTPLTPPPTASTPKPSGPITHG
ncbi:MAG TPA: ATP-binding protein [Candidatus Levybacteria bacterium]|nr:ATP-binding protein [Candidatus Levybacteria bacterium]